MCYFLRTSVRFIEAPAVGHEDDDSILIQGAQPFRYILPKPVPSSAPVVGVAAGSGETHIQELPGEVPTREVTLLMVRQGELVQGKGGIPS
jgi:hypothetical protein